MLIDRASLSRHLPWIVASLVVTVLATAWYFTAYFAAGGWDSRPSGSSLPGFTLGTIGGLICLFEFFLWPRTKVRAWRLGRVQIWMRAHIWLGLVAVPLLVLHSGFRWGGTLSATVMVLFLVVVASGVWGLVVQQFLPSRMLDGVPAETIYSQIHHVVGQMVREADRMVAATCGPEEDAKGKLLDDPADVEEVVAGHFVVGAMRTAGRVQGRVLETRTSTVLVPESEFLRVFFRESVKPYLLNGDKTRSPLRLGPRSTVLFEEARTRLPRAAHQTVDSLESLCDQRRQLDRQARLHHWLHNWLWFHLPLSIALILLMFVHVVVAIKYW